MKADEKQAHPTTTAVAEGVSQAVQRVKSANVWYFRIGGVVLVAVVVGVVWWMVGRESKKTSSEEWRGFLLGTGSSKYIRLEESRKRLGQNGIGQLQSRVPEERDKGLESIEQAREELERLADEFKDDKSLKAACYLEAADAELTLVGYFKKGSTTDTRGTVAAAAELYRKAAKAIGESTEVGEKLKARADQLESDPKAVKEASTKLSTQFAFAPSFGGGDGPKAPFGPLGPIGTPTPPKEEGPKPPDAPLTPPIVAPPTVTPPTTTPPAPPPVVPPTVVPPPVTPPAPTPDPNKK